MKRDIVVVGASAGGVEALMKLIPQLPADFPAAIFVVLHIPEDSTSLLPKIFNRVSKLDVLQPADDTPIEHRHIYVAPPNHHMLLEKDTIRLVRGPKENRHRPAIDPLFRSAALIYGPRVVGVILTGALDDGTAGLLAIKHQHGMAIVQDPKDALYPSMPKNALEYVQADYCAPLADLGPLLNRCVREETLEPPLHSSNIPLKYEVDMARLDHATLHQNQPAGSPSAFSCPECGGVLWEIQDGTFVSYRCRIGHAFSPENIQIAQAEKIEEALWIALKTLQEKASLTRSIQQQAQKNNQRQLNKTLLQRIEDIERNSDLLSHVLQSGIFSEVIRQSNGEPHPELHIDQD